LSTQNQQKIYFFSIIFLLILSVFPWPRAMPVFIELQRKKLTAQLEKSYSGCGDFSPNFPLDLTFRDRCQ